MMLSPHRILLALMCGMAAAGASALAAEPAHARLQASTTYVGLCDASAAVSLDADHFVVADDENDVLTVYQHGKPQAVFKLELADYLGNRKPSGKLKEADIEASARIGDRIYWITSHGRDKKGEVEPSRQRLFATEVLRDGAGTPSKSLPLPKSPPYKNLLGDMSADPRLAWLAKAAQRAPESAKGLSIEGLAATPEGHLLIGFRNPRPSGLALIVPLLNPRQVVDSGAKAVFGGPLRIDLGGRGIRSLESVGTRYLIVAGPYDDGERGGAGSDFALYTWTGDASQAPLRIEGVTFGSLHPEALFAVPGTQDIVMLSDDGGVPVDGVTCKDKDLPASKKSFRSLTLNMP